MKKLFVGVVTALYALAVSVTGAAAEPLTYVAIGASDAVGVGATIPSKEGWVPQLAGMLGPETRLVNLGVRGALLQDAMAYQLPVAIEKNPDVVTVWMGVNDFNAFVPLRTYSAQLDTTLAQLNDKTDARILVGNLPDLSRVTIYSEVLSFLGLSPAPVRKRVVNWNNEIARVAAKHGATLVDMYANWDELAQHPEYVSGDGFHPSSAGYARVAELFHTQLAS